MRELSIDIETRSSVDLAKCGVYRYAESDDFEILLFGYSEDGADVRVVDLARGEEIPARVMEALTDPGVTKWAFNASFERVCLSRFLHLTPGEYLSPYQWRCSMIWSAYNGLPLSLAESGKRLDLEQQKMKEGKLLIRHFCTFKDKTPWTPENHPDDWDVFKEYNRRDVEVELSIKEKLAAYPVPDEVWDQYHIDQEINDRGVLIDFEIVEVAKVLDVAAREELTSDLTEITGLENPNSVSQLKGWLEDQEVSVDTLGKKAVKSLIESLEGDTKQALELRLMLAKSSVKKYIAMENVAGADHRARGMTQFYGANRTGRWAGRYVQLQNLPQNHIEELTAARNLVKEADYEKVKLFYDSTLDVLSQLIRTAFVARPGTRFIVADFAAIEARVIAWLAGEKWRMETFANGGDIYCASASQMFKVPVVKHGVNGHLRQKGKIAELGLGYGGGTGALISMGAIEMGLKEEELQPIVDLWRAASPNIVKLWWDVDKAVKLALRKGSTIRLRNLKFTYRDERLLITLPSGRQLIYWKPKFTKNRFGGESVAYQGVDSTKKWNYIESYGPKFVENIVQAISRDILCNSMRNLRDLRIVMHIHDELVIEAPYEVSLEYVCQKMAEVPAWADGLLLRADGYETEYYRKD